MSFPAYLDNIQAKTGQTPGDFRRLAAAEEFLVNGTIPQTAKAGQIVDWLKHDLG